MIGTTSPFSRGPGRGRSGVVLGVAGAAVVAASVAVFAASSTGTRAGDLTTNDPTDAYVQATRAVGESICSGLIAVQNTGTDSIVLESVEANSADGLSLGTPTVLGPDRPIMLTGLADSCPAGGSPIRGYRLPPGQDTSRGPDWGIEVLVPITIETAGSHRINSFTVTYRQSGHTRQVQHTTAVVTCASDCDPAAVK